MKELKYSKKTLDEKTGPPCSIIYNKGKNCYITSTHREMGVMSASVSEYLDIKAGDYAALTKRFNSESGNSYEQLFFATAGNTPVNIDWNQVELSVYENKGINQLPFGVFRFCIQDYQLVIKPFVHDDTECKIIETSNNLMEIVKDFFAKKSLNRKSKKGVLLYGSPGNGKTSEIYKLRKFTEEGNFRIFFIDEGVNLSSLSDYRSILSKDNTIFVMEEVTDTLKNSGAKTLLTFLDGEHSWNNAITIATTNYPEKLPDNIIDRPGRFDTFLEYKNPTNEEIKKLSEVFGITEGAEFLYNKDLSFDYVSFILDKTLNSKTTIKECYKFEKDKRTKLGETFKGKIGL